MLKAGDEAPDFTLLDQDENEFTLSKAGTKVLVYFYPMRTTPSGSSASLEPAFSGASSAQALSPRTIGLLTGNASCLHPPTLSVLA